MLFLLISFIAGVLTVLAPCILPLLPVIIGSSVQGGSNKRAYTVIGSLVVSVVLFTLLIKVSTVFLDIPQETWKYLSAGILGLLALTYIFRSLWDRLSFVGKLSTKSNKALGKGFQKNTFLGDIVAGSALGPVFSTCSPTYFVILATVLPASFVLGMVYLTSYALGLGLVLLAISLLGQKFADKLGVLADPEGKFKKIIGAMFLLVAIAIATGFDKKIETAVLNSGYFDITKLEQKLLEKTEPINSSKEDVSDADISELSLKPIGKYTEIVGASGYVNTDGQSIKISDYIGKKIIVVDFMTYSCINCQRTFPYLNDWYDKYKDQGLIIIGIHTPEFAFEKNIKNVESELSKMGIKFPVVLDNDYTTWNAYKNNFWPRKYIIDLNGNVVYDHIGEGKYDETEAVIQKLLKTIPGNENIDSKVIYHNTGDLSKVKSPETYLGYLRAEGNTNKITQDCLDSYCKYTKQKNSLNKWSFGGDWKIENERALGKVEGTLNYTFLASKFHLVAGSKDVAKIKVTLDGTMSKTYEVKKQTLYTLSDFGDVYGTHTIDIEIVSGELEVYAITFG